MTLSRQILSIILAATFACFNLQALDLHVHAPTARAPGSNHHQHGPAFHHHSTSPMPLDAARIAGVDDDDTVLPVRICAAPTSAKSVAAPSVVTERLGEPNRTLTNVIAVVARAHGPPTCRPVSLRAPPASPLV